MKTLILNGSPRINGDSVMLLQEMQKYLDGDINILSAYYDGISPCTDCRFCWENAGCIHADPMQRVLEDLDSYDNVIISSPLYFSQLTGALLNICSRFQQLYTARNFRGIKEMTTRKNGVLIIAGGGDGSYKQAESTGKILFGCLNADYLGMVLTHNTNSVPSKDDKLAMGKAKEMALLLNEIYNEKALVKTLKP